MEHSFNVEDAVEYGILPAVLLKNILFWQLKNAANGQNYHDGRYWTYNSVKAFSELFYYVTPKQIRGAINTLVEKGAIVTGCYNESPYDRTLWYSVTDVGMKNFSGIRVLPRSNSDLPCRENENSRVVKCNIDTNINTDINTDINNNVCSDEIDSQEEGKTEEKKEEKAFSEDFKAVWEEYPRKKEKKRAYSCYKARLKDYSADDLLKATMAYAQECRRKKTEEKFIKLPATFFGINEPFADYMNRELEEDKYKVIEGNPFENLHRVEDDRYKVVNGNPFDNW